MLTYNLTKENGALYEELYRYIKEDIKKGILCSKEKLPSKRMLAKNLGVSSITVENAYNQLIDEGYIYSLPKKGYFVADISGISQIHTIQNKKRIINIPDNNESVVFDFSSNRIEAYNFPFSIWTKLIRETMSMKETELMTVSPSGGVYELREAIAKHLSSFRGMDVDPNQIIVGAGTEYLYGLIIKLLGEDKIYGLENPGYRKISQVYESNRVDYRFIDLDDKGVIPNRLIEEDVDVIHISPTHHFPTGISMPLSRRQELLNYVSAKNTRYVIEDDYDSEFRINGKPLPTLSSIDVNDRVIYMNTFSKSLTSTIRISYMVLPEHLANEFYRRLSFFSCTVSNFDQYTLAAFISRGYFEKHINRMRLHYIRKRRAVLEQIEQIFDKKECRIIENDSGLHFVLELSTLKSDAEIKSILLEKGIKILAVSDFDMCKNNSSEHRFILNYSGIDINGLNNALSILKASI